MTIIVDFTQVSIANLMAQLGRHTNTEVSVEIFRHLVLNSLRAINVKFRGEYGEMVIACDSTHNWRRDVFPHYKAGRRKTSSESDIDWNAIFACINTMKQELREYFPYRVIEVDRAEADDVIGTLIHTYAPQNPTEKYLIVSGDKDFIQLQIYSNVDQYDPVHTKAIKTSKQSPDQFLFEHVLKGDAGDGIPNVLSDPDTLIDPDKKQRPLTAKRVKAFADGSWKSDDQAEFWKERIELNTRLIDLGFIPSAISEQILTEYENYEHRDRSRLLTYFIKNRLKLLSDKLSDF
jgi:hypothetical protein